MKEKGILLLPGGGMSSWVWTKIVELIEFDTICPEYRVAENTLESRKNVHIEDCVDYLISLISDWDSVVVVGHSGAGILAASLAKKIPDKVLGVIYVSANIPKNHTSAVDSLPFLLRLINSLAIKSQTKKLSTPMAKKRSIVKNYFCNNSDEATINYILQKQLLSEPLCLAFEKVDWDNFPDIPQMYIVLTKDKTQSIKKQEGMMENINIKNSNHIEGDHMVMLSSPELLANTISSFCVDLESSELE